MRITSIGKYTYTYLHSYTYKHTYINTYTYKVSLPVSVYLAGGKLVALNKFREGQPTDVRPIAVGETLRRLTGKCLYPFKGQVFFFLPAFIDRGCLQGRGGNGHPQP